MGQNTLKSLTKNYKIGTSAWAVLGQQIGPVLLSVTVLGQDDRAVCRLLQLHLSSAMGTISTFSPVLIPSLLQSWDSPKVFSTIVPGAFLTVPAEWQSDRDHGRAAAPLLLTAPLSEPAGTPGGKELWCWVQAIFSLCKTRSSWLQVKHRI